MEHFLTYSVKEIFYSLQGEGVRVGRPAVFCRFAGCNLWTGREKDRAKSVCQFCDTDFVGTDGINGGKYETARDLADKIASIWPTMRSVNHYVVFTGGEPLLQLDEALINEMHQRGFEVAIETNGTKKAPPGIDWICVSPKVGAPLKQKTGHELKIVVPQENLNLDDYETLDFEYFLIQPKDSQNIEQNIKIAIQTCLKNPKWRLSIQAHKYLQIP